MKKVIILVLLFSISSTALMACPVCERNQPKILRGVVHGQGADTQWDYLIIGIVAAIVLLAIYLTIKGLIRPGEQQTEHIKRTVLEE